MFFGVFGSLNQVGRLALLRNPVHHRASDNNGVGIPGDEARLVVIRDAINESMRIQTRRAAATRRGRGGLGLPSE